MKIVQRILDALITIYLIALIALLITGGFEYEVLGIPVSVHGAKSLLRVLIPASVLRLVISTRFNNTLLVLGSTVLALIFAEIGLRFLDPPIAQPALTQIHRPSDDFGWELIPGAGGVGHLGQEVQVNSAGMRDREMSTEAAPGTQRVAVIGDSFTFGLGVKLDEIYAKQLETALAQEHPGVTVMNFGVIGYQLWQYRKVLESRVLRFDPDLVILGMFADDIGMCHPPVEKDPNWTPVNPFDLAYEDKFTSSYLLNLLRNVALLLETKYRYHRGHKYLQGMDERRESIAEDPSSPMHHLMYGKKPEEFYSACLEVFQEIGRWSRDQNVPVLVSIIPDAAQVGIPAHQHFNRFVEESAAAAGLLFVDTTPEFEQHSDPKVLYLFPLDAHTSVEGHQLIANTLARKISTLSLFGPS